MPAEGIPRRLSFTKSVASDRIITQFPQAYHLEGTPNQTIGFNQQVRDACSQNKTGTVGLKICKAVLVGDVAVGKSCLVNRFCHHIFDRDYKATIGVDFEVEKFNILNVPFNLQLWDTAGQERFKCIAASYYRGADVVLVAFDLTDIGSLGHCLQWQIDACKSAREPLVFLVGTKKDLMIESTYAQVEQEALKIAQEMNAEFWATSAKNGECVKEFFFRIVSLAFEKAMKRELNTMDDKQKSIGNELIKIDRPREDIYEKKKFKSKCCA